MFTNRYYKKFFTISSTNGSSLAELDTMQASQELARILKGYPIAVTEIRDGDLLVEVANEEQSYRILNTKVLNNTTVTVAPHGHLNQIKGTIRYPNKPRYTPEKILDHLREQKVSDLYQIKRKSDGVLVDTNIYILTFDAAHLPDIITIGWTRCEVNEYIPRPRRCFKCQKFGHGKNSCRGSDTCVRCGLDGHGECDRDPRCSNCKGPHPASDRVCDDYWVEQEALTLQARNRISYREAKRITNKKNGKEDEYNARKEKDTYASRLRSVPPTRATATRRSAPAQGSAASGTQQHSSTQPSQQPRRSQHSKSPRRSQPPTPNPTANLNFNSSNQTLDQDTKRTPDKQFRQEISKPLTAPASSCKESKKESKPTAVMPPPSPRTFSASPISTVVSSGTIRTKHKRQSDSDGDLEGVNSKKTCSIPSPQGSPITPPPPFPYPSTRSQNADARGS